MKGYFGHVNLQSICNVRYYPYNTCANLNAKNKKLQSGYSVFSSRRKKGKRFVLTQKWIKAHENVYCVFSVFTLLLSNGLKP